MTTIVTRSGKGSPLTNTEVDANFTNLNTDKVETSGAIDTDASAEIGRVKIGAIFSDFAAFTHRDHHTTTGWGFLQSHTGASFINAPTGQAVNFLINNTDIAYVHANGFQLNTGKNLFFEGATADDFETTLTVTDPTADRTITLPDATGQVVLSDGAIDTNASAEIGRAHIGYMGFDDYAGFSHIDANGTGTYALRAGSSGQTLINAATGAFIYFRNNDSSTAHIGGGGLYMYSGKTISFEGSTDNSSETFLTVADPTADRTITFPDATGTVITTGNSDTPTTTTSSSDADFVLVDDGGTMKKITPANLGIGSGSGGALTNQTWGASLDSDSANESKLFFKNDHGNIVIGAGGTVAEPSASLDETGSATNNIFIGNGAGTSATTAVNSVFIGTRTGEDITTGDQNVFIGYEAGKDTNADIDRIVSVGYQSGFAMPNGGYQNITTVGFQAGMRARENSVCVGTLAGANAYYSAGGSWQGTHVGSLAGYNYYNYYANYNTNIGYAAGDTNRYGDYATVIGWNADTLDYDIDHCVAIGAVAKAATKSVSIGVESQNSGNSGSIDMISIGYKAGYDMDGGDSSVFIGYQSGYGGGTADGNIGVGRGTLYNLTSGAGNVSVGHQAHGALTEGSNNTAVGYQAGNTSTTGEYNVFVGYQAGCDPDGTNANTGDYNVGVGALALEDVTSGAGNVGIGRNALAHITTGSSNVAIGNLAGDANTTTGDNNILIGYAAKNSSGGGSDNGIAIGYNADAFTGAISIGYKAMGAYSSAALYGIAIGYEAHFDTEGSDYSIMIGYQAGYEGSSANGNIGIGYKALYGTNGLTTGAYNVAVGYQAGWEIEQGAGNVYMGYKAGYENRHSDYAVFIGYEADEDSVGLSDYAVAIGYKAKASGSNVSVGREAGSTSVNCTHTTLLGYRAGYDLTGDQSTFVGAAAGRGYNATLTGDDNVGVGFKALYDGTSGEKNTAVGTESLENISTGSYNVAVGNHAGDSVTTGEYNICIGQDSDPVTASATAGIAIGKDAKADTYCISIGASAQKLASSSNPPANTITIGTSAGYNLNGADDCTMIGHHASNGTAWSGSNNTCIGHDADPSSQTASNEVTLGDSNIATLRCQVTSITALSDERDKTAIEDLDLGLKFVNAMKPRKFTWNRRDGKWEGKKEIGFIAQELHEVEMDFSSTSRTRLVSHENPSRLEAQPMNTYPILVKAIQELSAKVDSLQAEVTKLKGA